MGCGLSRVYSSGSRLIWRVIAGSVRGVSLHMVVSPASPEEPVLFLGYLFAGNGRDSDALIGVVIGLIFSGFLGAGLFLAGAFVRFVGRPLAYIFGYQ